MRQCFAPSMTTCHANLRALQGLILRVEIVALKLDNVTIYVSSSKNMK